MLVHRRQQMLGAVCSEKRSAQQKSLSSVAAVLSCHHVLHRCGPFTGDCSRSRTSSGSSARGRGRNAGLWSDVDCVPIGGGVLAA